MHFPMPRSPSIFAFSNASSVVTLDLATRRWRKSTHECIQVRFLGSKTRQLDSTDVAGPLARTQLGTGSWFGTQKSDICGRRLRSGSPQARHNVLLERQKSPSKHLLYWHLIVGRGNCASRLHFSIRSHWYHFTKSLFPTSLSLYFYMSECFW